MAQLRGSVGIPTESSGEFDELDHIPLITRRKLLLGSKRMETLFMATAVKKEDEDNEELLSTPFLEGIDHRLAMKQSSDCEAALGVAAEVSNDEILENSTKVVGATDYGLAKVEVRDRVFYKNLVLSYGSANIKVENSENNLSGATGVGTDPAAYAVHTNIPDDFADDDLDHMILKERRRMLLQRKCLELKKQATQGTSVAYSEDQIDRCAGRITEDPHLVPAKSLMSGGEYIEVPKREPSNLDGSGSPDTAVAAPSCAFNQHSEMLGKSLVPEAINSRKITGYTEIMCSSKKAFEEFNSCGQCEMVPGSSAVHIPTIQSPANDKTERTENCELNHSKMNSLEMCSSASAVANSNSCDGQDYVWPESCKKTLNLETSMKIKVEPVEHSDLNHLGKNSLNSFCSKTTVKSEMVIPNEIQGDGLDHLPLQVRMKKRTMAVKTEFDSSCNVVYSNKTVHPSLQGTQIAPESAKPIRLEPLRKRKKTATDSVETALEEDAPGLLKVLRDQGVSVDEIKLYGEAESDDALDDVVNEESFSELEAVMSKVFFQHNSLFKFASVRCSKDSKPSYCLACLFSLVEQARYLQFRKWPVEWGWCRELQSFIFVFQRHKRIVLERPEYGYATYFFELVDFLPLEWQIKRLVCTMKLTSCGRVNLIENKSLTVGEDLTEGEAKVLMEFGWIPNTGIGTMLKYHDRVFHDRKNEKLTSEWRSKIGKLLVDGYNGGTIVSTSIPENVVNFKIANSSEVKLV